MLSSQRIHFVGVGGAGMSAIAVVLLAKGVEVSGSDLKESRNTHRLEELGARIFIGHRAENVEGADVLVVSSAVPERNRELKRAKELGLTILPRAAMLNLVMGESKGIAVAGTHGKTTTTSMVAMIMKESGLDPSYIIGGELNDVGSNAHAGSGEYLIAEADESDGSFLLLNPWAEIVTNVEEDHLDFFEGREEIVDYFRRFVSLPPAGGIVVLSGDDPGCRLLAGFSKAREVTFGEGEQCDLYLRDLKLMAGGSNFEVLREGVSLGRITLAIPGSHNVHNAMAALALTLSLDVDFAAAARALAAFRGVMRRYQLIDEVGGIRLVDDYAHHPSEVKTTLKAARLEGPDRLVCMFQPHRYSRTAALFREFGEALLGADTVILTDVYAAGEEPLPGINGKLIVNAVLEADPSKEVVYIPKRSMLGEAAARMLRPGDLVLTMGAGDISQCASELAGILRGEKPEDCG
ncbi:MAG: UDP-N-acetylmuramate--L-alanine ligase [Actinobacteria bacterium RBG_19FT_COMBO_54_7]|uniref:UDP-N-acetylmuramate--L-alanine ligase n=1 Tax=Candidatus Solincola sediminis TaxID=1797199 RepID=A0A1F2WRU6_9ACTN|nr:MAG: UDP-N-acetylmuramate--L-alanine ligase [Candidatus Solincola sediminis]OFW60939.1 MAG: UDP-N-acetylmuramate--L-alanine ligase [Candidatus Solincola sediminis]OFW66205.1 MAG: UDP-N-acetylmuramate--L-alanine ligase [Actinobacteria bacterium RBG_19FT_COMBO_54_7]